MPKIASLLLMLVTSVLMSCASSDKKVARPYEVKTYPQGFDFSTLKKKNVLYISHANGIYYQGKVNLEKSTSGLLCLYQGSGTKCFRQNEIKEITQSKSSGINGGVLATNLMMVLILVGLIYILPSAG